MTNSVNIRPFLAGDVVQLTLQRSQHVTLGILKARLGIADGRELEDAGPAWSAIGADGRMLTCYGFAYLHPPSELTGGHALAWALLADGVGAAHLAITRYAQRTIAESPISRIEAIVRASVTAERKWVELVGFHLVASLRAWGPEAETHLLYERVKADDCAPFQMLERPLQLEAMGAV